MTLNIFVPNSEAWKAWQKEIKGSIKGCLNDALDKANPEMVGKPRNLSCPCPKCTTDIYEIIGRLPWHYKDACIKIASYLFQMESDMEIIKMRRDVGKKLDTAIFREKYLKP